MALLMDSNLHPSQGEYEVVQIDLKSVNIQNILNKCWYIWISSYNIRASMYKRTMFLYIDVFVCKLYEVLPFSFMLSCGCAVLQLSVFVQLFIERVLDFVHNHISLTLFYTITQSVHYGVFTPKRLLSNAIFNC